MLIQYFEASLSMALLFTFSLNSFGVSGMVSMCGLIFSFHWVSSMSSSLFRNGMFSKSFDTMTRSMSLVFSQSPLTLLPKMYAFSMRIFWRELLESSLLLPQPLVAFIYNL